MSIDLDQGPISNATTGAPLPGGGPGPPGRPAGRPPRRFAILLAFMAGMLVGAGLLAGFQASGAVPPPDVRGAAPTAEDGDLIVTLRGPYINRLVEANSAEQQGPVKIEHVQVEILPGRRLILTGELPLLGTRLVARSQVDLDLVDGRPNLEARDFQVGALHLPPELAQNALEPINVELERIAATTNLTLVDIATAPDRIIVTLADRTTAGAAP